MTSPLDALYPGMRRQPSVQRDELLTSVRAKASDSAAVKTAFFEGHAAQLIEVAEAIAASYRSGGRLFTMGNGGSSSDAAHVAVEFNHPVTVGRPALPAIHLGADLQLLTALANDVGFEQVFARQVMSLGRPADVLLGLSTSGNSRNLLNAFEAAKRVGSSARASGGQGLTTIAFTGGDGGRCRGHPAVDHCLIVDSASIHRVQECHVAAYHILWDLVHTLLAQDRGPGVSR